MSLSLDLENGKGKGNSPKNSDEVRVPKGRVIFLEGDPSPFFYFIQKGKVQVIKENEGRVVPLAVLGEKEFLGEMGIFDKGTRCASAIAIEETILIKMGRTEIVQQMDLFPEWIRKIMLTLVQRLRIADEIIKDYKIVDEQLTEGKQLTAQEEVEFQRILKEYRSALPKK